MQAILCGNAHSNRMNSYPMEQTFYHELTQTSLQDEQLSDAVCEQLLTSPDVALLPLLAAAYQVRQTYFQNEVQLHILNNAQNGLCPEDCGYCAQARSATAAIEPYSLKPEAELLAEARAASEAGASRYCIVLSGRGPSRHRVRQLAQVIHAVKTEYPMEVCLSVGLLDAAGARALKAAGLDRLNHNLNTSEAHYPNICSTHTYQDRMDTLQAAQTAGLACCSGVIVGLGETDTDLIAVAKTLRRLEVASVPVNFFLPIAGTQIAAPSVLTPDYCLRVLCLYRFLNPRAEIRMAAGREHHLRSLEAMALYPANSLFLEGYLNAAGAATARTLQMIRDAGFTVKRNGAVEERMISSEGALGKRASTPSEVVIKELEVLRPRMQSGNS